VNELSKDTLRRWLHTPVAMVEETFGAKPDAWQREVLEAFPSKNRIAMKASKGPGKTAVEAWLIWNFLVTRPHARVGAASITWDNLTSNLWPELAKWQERSPFCRETFRWTATALTHEQYPATWWAKARSWPKRADPEAQADSLAGLHGDYAMWVLDESGSMPVAVLTSAEGVLASGIETKVVQGGNTTDTQGALYRATNQDRRLWFVVTINGDPDDPKRSPRIDVEWARELIKSYGRDNPWVMVNVLGQFPPGSFNALLSLQDVEAAMGRHLRSPDYDWAQKRLGIDIARYGDDRTVIFPRQGLAAFQPIVMRHTRNPKEKPSNDIANRVMRAKAHWKSELELMDATGGWGAGARDVLLTAGVPVVEVQFGAPAFDPRYKNRRAEIWFRMAEWVKGGAALPHLPAMVPELVEPTYSFTPDGKFLIEPKELVKKRLGSSPDLADALAVTFGFPEMPRDGGDIEQLIRGQGHRAKADWDPFAVRE
jgi:phage terminase large subunit